MQPRWFSRTSVFTVGLLALVGIASGSRSPAHGSPIVGKLSERPSTETLTVKVRGVELQYVEQGKGPAVVLVHGSMGDFSDWNGQIAELAQHYRVIAYSRRFHSPNTTLAPGGRYDMDEQAEDLASLIQTLHAAPAHVVGHSYGAYTSLRMALRHPKLVRSLVLGEPPILGWVSGTPEADSVGHALFAGALDLSRDAFARGDSVDGMRKFLDGVTGKPGYFDGVPSEAKQEILHAATEMRGEMTTPRDRYMPTISCGEVRAFKKPMLVLTAERSPRFFHIITQKLATCRTAPDTATITRAGHALQVGNPGEFNQKVLTFLAKH